LGTALKGNDYTSAVIWSWLPRILNQQQIRHSQNI